MEEYEILKKYFIDKEKENIQLKEELELLKSKTPNSFIENTGNKLMTEDFNNFLYNSDSEHITGNNFKRDREKDDIKEKEHLMSYFNSNLKNDSNDNIGNSMKRSRSGNCKDFTTISKTNFQLNSSPDYLYKLDTNLTSSNMDTPVMARTQFTTKVIIN
jgi:hypothetical protein